MNNRFETNQILNNASKEEKNVKENVIFKLFIDFEMNLEEINQLIENIQQLKNFLDKDKEKYQGYIVEYNEQRKKAEKKIQSLYNEYDKKIGEIFSGYSLDDINEILKQQRKQADTKNDSQSKEKMEKTLSEFADHAQKYLTKNLAIELLKSLDEKRRTLGPMSFVLSHVVVHTLKDCQILSQSINLKSDKDKEYNPHLFSPEKAGTFNSAQTLNQALGVFMNSEKSSYLTLNNSQKEQVSIYKRTVDSELA